MAAAPPAPARPRKRYRATVAARVQPVPSYVGQPVTREQQLEVTPRHLQQWLPQLPGKPLRLWHEKMDVGTVVNACLNSDMKLDVEFEFEEGKFGKFVEKRFNEGMFPEVSLSHYLNDALEPIEVSLCEMGAREGTKVHSVVTPFVPVVSASKDAVPIVTIPMVQQTNSSIKPPSEQKPPELPPPVVSAAMDPRADMFQQLALGAIGQELKRTQGASSSFEPAQGASQAQLNVLRHAEELARATGPRQPMSFNQQPPGGDVSMQVEAPLPSPMQQQMQMQQQQQQQQQQMPQTSQAPSSSSMDSKQPPQQPEQIADLRFKYNNLVANNNKMADLIARSALPAEDMKALEEHLVASQELAKAFEAKLNSAVTERDAAESRARKSWHETMEQRKQNKRLMKEYYDQLGKDTGRTDLPKYAKEDDVPDEAATQVHVAAAAGYFDMRRKQDEERKMMEMRIQLLQEQNEKDRQSQLQMAQQQRADAEKLSKLRSVAAFSNPGFHGSSSSSSSSGQSQQLQAPIPFPIVNASMPYSSSSSFPSSSSSSSSPFVSSSNSSSASAYQADPYKDWAQPARPEKKFHPPVMTSNPVGTYCFPAPIRHELPPPVVQASADGQLVPMHQLPTIHKLFDATVVEAASFNPIRREELDREALYSEWTPGQNR